MSDLIRREDAIKALRCEYPTMPIFKGLREEWAIKTEGFRKAEEVIMNLPSADIDLSEYSDKLWRNAYERGKADRPQGEWIAKTESYHSHWVCSECGSWALLEYNEQMCLSNFCPNCGAYMKGADDE